MNMEFTHYRTLAAALAFCAALGACSGSKKDVARTDTSATTAEEAKTSGNTLDTMASGGAVTGNWTDASIFAYLTAANNGEIAEGSLAERMATNPAVKAFARQMVTDHRKMLQDGKSLATKLNVKPDTTNSDVSDLRKDAESTVRDLTKKRKGADWDRAYIDKQVDAHQKVIDHINDFIRSAQSPELRSMLQQALPKVQQHLASAKDIQNNKLKS
jgi:putative membrane protein